MIKAPIDKKYDLEERIPGVKTLHTNGRRSRS